MVQATATLQERISRLDRKLTAKQTEELQALVTLLGFKLTPLKARSVAKTGKPVLKSKWYRPQTLAALSCGPSTATGLMGQGQGRLHPWRWRSLAFRHCRSLRLAGGVAMSHFYGTLKGQAGEATRRGSRNSGLRVTAASWQGAVYTYLWHDDETGKDHYRVELGPW